MRVKFMGILSVEAALKAVENDGYALRYVAAAACTEAVALQAVKSNGYALQYVLDLRLFLKIAAHFNIAVDAPKVDETA